MIFGVIPFSQTFTWFGESESNNYLKGISIHSFGKKLRDANQEIY